MIAEHVRQLKMAVNARPILVLSALLNVGHCTKYINTGLLISQVDHFNWKQCKPNWFSLGNQHNGLVENPRSWYSCDYS